MPTRNSILVVFLKVGCVEVVIDRSVEKDTFDISLPDFRPAKLSMPQIQRLAWGDYESVASIDWIGYRPEGFRDR